MRYVLFVLAALVMLGGCNAVSDKYQEGRDKQNQKENKMIDENSSTE